MRLSEEGVRSRLVVDDEGGDVQEGESHSAHPVHSTALHSGIRMKVRRER